MANNPELILGDELTGELDTETSSKVMDYLSQRKQEYEDLIVGDVGGNFRYDREHLIDSVGKAAEKIVETYDHSLEAQKMAENAQLAVAGTAGFVDDYILNHNQKICGQSNQMMGKIRLLEYPPTQPLNSDNVPGRGPGAVHRQTKR